MFRIFLLNLTILSFSSIWVQAQENTMSSTDESSISLGDVNSLNKDVRTAALSFIGPIPSSTPGSKNDTPAMVRLGEKLYFETNLSKNRSQSCNSCHNILNGGSGTDGLRTSIGAFGISGRRNAPTTFNTGFQTVQNWDGSAKTLEIQAQSPLLDKNEMALSSKKEAVKRLRKHYKKEFKAAFPNYKIPLSFDNITKALAAFQRTLITEDRFNKFIKGDNTALTTLEKQGFKTFQKYGCTSCHSGPMMGGQFMMKLGVVNPYANTEDKGLADITGREEHNFLFKVPTLRNVADTAPYFHDGATSSLKKVVALTGWHQLGLTLPEKDIEAITAFLYSLSNEAPYQPSLKND